MTVDHLEAQMVALECIIIAYMRARFSLFSVHMRLLVKCRALL